MKLFTKLALCWHFWNVIQVTDKQRNEFTDSVAESENVQFLNVELVGFILPVTTVDKNQKKGAWMAQSTEHLTLGFCSGHALRIVGLSPESGSALSIESPWDSPFATPPPLSYIHDLSF